MIPLCESCGSISIRPTTPKLFDRIVAVVTGRRPFLCRRCGWRARRDWADEDLNQLQAYGAGGAETDPALVALDSDQRQKHQSGRRRNEPPAESFDFGTLSFSDGDQPVGELSRWTGVDRARDVPKKRYRRRTKRNRRVIAAGLVAAAIITFILVFLTFAAAN